MIRFYFACILLVVLGLAPMNASATLYEDEHIRIDTPDLLWMETEGDRKLWCMKRKLDVLYKMPRKEKERTITLQYIAPIAFDILSKHCEIPSDIQLSYYPENVGNYLEHIGYSFCKSSGNRMYCIAEDCKLEHATASKPIDGPIKTAEHVKLAKEKPYRHFEIHDGVFSDLPGGKYIKAIYDNDIATIKNLDIKTYGALVKRKNKARASSLLAYIAHKYMYMYKANYGRCLKSNAITRTFRVRVGETRFENGYGGTVGSLPGYTVTNKYTVNPEFSFILEKVGDSDGPGVEEAHAKRNGWIGVDISIEDVKALYRNYKCDCAEIKRFEKNLIYLTTELLTNQLY